MVLTQIAEGRAAVENQYARVVPDHGNPVSLAAIADVYERRPSFEWRGLGEIESSGLRIRDTYRAHDAEGWDQQEEAGPEHERGARQAVLEQGGHGIALLDVTASLRGQLQHGGVPHECHQAVELFQRTRRATAHQKIHRLRQAPQHDGHHQRRGQAAEHEDRAPAMVCQQPGGHEPAQRGANRIASRRSK